ncbi:VTT domain-containing protein [Suttonella sp. R2A3]|uniref:DedA family protein n=1 Tax=Suttonella sp. R2A3 TaxID=2908648 RepID=UPI001F2B1766|nr:VTT domain-containing protein [Suttonella sp. R2A3]UJF23784.1 VTT domain-containing protein [Suttonella sp. R2A3]
MPDWLASWLNTPWLPLLLFAGAFGDAFLFTSVLVFGELFFIASGYVSAQTHNYWLLGIVWLGAFMGDVSSFAFGRHVGVRGIRRITHRRAKWRLNVQRAIRMLRNKGARTVFFARLLGPISKITPFLAGALNMRWRPFLCASGAGVMCASTQFILIGWLLAHGINAHERIVPWIIEQHYWLLPVIIVLIGVVIVYRLRHRQSS